MDAQSLITTAQAMIANGKGVLASARLNAVNFCFKSRLPWVLTFPFSRAIQQSALEIWSGQNANVEAAQKSLLHRARCNRAACAGEYVAAMEKT